jgi:hypothetical protein
MRILARCDTGLDPRLMHTCGTWSKGYCAWMWNRCGAAALPMRTWKHQVARAQTRGTIAGHSMNPCTRTSARRPAHACMRAAATGRRLQQELRQWLSHKGDAAAAAEMLWLPAVRGEKAPHVGVVLGQA